MSTDETTAIRSSVELSVASRPPLLSRNNIRVLSFFVVFMALNTVLRYIPHPDAEPRISFNAIGYSLGTGFGSLFLFWLLCKGLEIARRVAIKENLVYIVMTVIGVGLYLSLFIAIFGYIMQSSGAIFSIVMLAVPLVLAFYFVVGFIIGLFARMIASDQHS